MCLCKYTPFQPERKGQPEDCPCICKIVRRSRARQRVTADFRCKCTQILVNPCYVPRTYFLDARFVLQHLALAHAANAGQCAGRYVGRECFQQLAEGVELVCLFYLHDAFVIGFISWNGSKNMGYIVPYEPNIKYTRGERMPVARLAVISFF